MVALGPRLRQPRPCWKNSHIIFVGLVTSVEGQAMDYSVTNGGFGLAIGMVFFVLSLGMYLLPGIVATLRHHRHAAGIWLLDIFLGWTFLGWIGALIWACTSPDAAPVFVPVPAASPRPAGPTTVADEIEQFAKLRTAGVITEEEFLAKKRQLLGLGDEGPAAPESSPA
jgi:hypothetical protein